MIVIILINILRNKYFLSKLSQKEKQNQKQTKTKNKSNHCLNHTHRVENFSQNS